MSDPAGVPQATGITSLEWFADGQNGSSQPSEPQSDRDSPAARQMRSFEFAVESARRRAVQAEGVAAELTVRVADLEHELRAARHESRRLSASLADRERARLAAEQRAHAELALRLDREEQLAERRRDGAVTWQALGERAESEQRVRELERELERLWRRVHEAEQIAAVAATARPGAERRTEEVSSPLIQLRAELDALRSALQRETAARIDVELRADQLERELSARRGCPERADDAIEELRRALDAVRAVESPAPPTPPAAGPVEPQRLNEAFSRLRETIALPPDPTDEGDETIRSLGPARASERTRPGPAKPWLAPVFNALVRTDAASAGRLLLDLLPAQAVAYPHSVAYDLVLGEPPGFVQVTVRGGMAAVGFGAAARARGEVDFQAFGSPARLARLVAAGVLWRRWRRGMARIRGERRSLAALRSLVGHPLHLGELHAAGVRIEPALALTIVSLMIDPAWTAGERFAVAYTDGEAGAQLQVRDGAALTVRAVAPAEPAATTIVGSADSLLLLLAGGPRDELTIRGEERPLMLLLDWVQRAQSG
jgi:hypothetical protein